MTYRTSLAASLALAALALAACGGKPGKAEFVEVCMQKAGGAQECNCYVDNLHASVTAEQFDQMAKAVVDNQRFGGFIPAGVRRDATVDSAIASASASCLTQG
jgi:hypothetical protein